MTMSKYEWRRSSRSGANGDNCVEVATTPDRVLVRDSKDPDGGMLSVPAEAFRAFIAATRRQEFGL